MKKIESLSGCVEKAVIHPKETLTNSLKYIQSPDWNNGEKCESELYYNYTEGAIF